MLEEAEVTSETAQAQAEELRTDLAQARVTIKELEVRPVGRCLRSSEIGRVRDVLLRVFVRTNWRPCEARVRLHRC